MNPEIDTYQITNLALISAFKGFYAISFFKFTSVQEIVKKEALVKAYLFEAIEVEKAGLKVEFKKNPEPVPLELQLKLDEDMLFKTSFESFTPGRQRGYILHFSQAKQSKTRLARIKKCTAKILNGEGLHETYKHTEQSQ
jgi:uncharacterized protein YdeI (YjbR/CyaY-like superfamily)